MRVYIGLGSNLADPEQQIRQALRNLKALPKTQYIAASSLYRSPPMGPADQPDYLNAVAAVETDLSPLDLLQALQQIEKQHGRERLRHWGERTLDLDILLYDQRQIQEPLLTIPHPGLTTRAFVVRPLHEIAGDVLIPGHANLGQYVAALADAHCEKLKDGKL
ncbi:2-amino-4-hydroxy-6- hydroxymethyldihydropteridine pyrophosphokinase [Methylophaga frappieri]|uniref:2-amino-4-hydroxy-6-hydroxymethyldihydropteridine pyrophosphokinase n=1 Tax=Methylophaga frappieri (strain ATCC BAA-2434 / DSM 25690 / JAM7) TaxID=754477 RepID=I1YKY0_METFJ|nr:2-amino-4-hydroxy-6-hydroxymethyldihydropteridine diphosphokinase [Methylophaga frappieri]AFJ03573.1 2-amino-4-hydroxy-6- hydroxymethyldihydropteridine pyrophosphokinase [Methylophaga frappieri]